ncbi:MAG: mobile mystery protein A [Oleiphilaceae bacterium]|nr:mobile mystery protein A [Oleiphilaceae bacterium]
MSNSSARWLRLEQLDRRMQPFREALQESPPPVKGWIHALRTAQGMSQAELARRMGVSRRRIGAIEQAEVDGSITLATLQKAASALGSQLVFGLATEDNLTKIVEQQAELVAERIMATVHHTMSLEEQATDQAHRQREKQRLKDELLRDSWRKLWL